MSISPANLRPKPPFPSSSNPSRQESIVSRVAQRVLIGAVSGLICAAPAALAVCMVRAMPTTEVSSNRTAEIGLVVYGSCMTACSTAVGEALMPVCTTLCIPLLAMLLP